MRRKTMLLVAAAAGVTLCAPVSAAPAPPQITDERGDANGVNDQGLGDSGLPDVATATEPVSYAGADIVSVRLATTYARRRVAGFTVTMTLAAPPVDGVAYKVRADVPGCTWLHVWYERGVAVPPLTRVHCGDVGWEDDVPPARVTGSRIVWTLPLRDLNGWVRAGHVLTGLEADTAATVRAELPPASPERYVGPRPANYDRAVTEATYRVA